MRCPRCYRTDFRPVGDTHYICNNPSCMDDNGRRTQFKVETDESIQFPYNQIFISRKTEEFYKESYIKTE